MSLTAAQCRAARALLGWNQGELAERSKVAKPTIANFELGNRAPYERTLRDIRAAMEAAGVIFLDAGEVSTAGAEGVRLKHSEGVQVGLDLGD
jgi:transcriptional regulator with XRE-family HTH domain